MFGGTGWLFADLMVALAMAFLVATTVGFPPPPPVHKPPKPPQVRRIKRPQPALNFKYIDIKFTIDPTSVLDGGPSAGSQILNAISGSRELSSHCTGRLRSGCVGLVLLFGGVPVDTQADYEYAGRLDKAVWSVLRVRLGAESNLFSVAVPRDFSNTNTATTQFELNIYVFKNA